MERDLGNLGESCFTKYCHEIGLTPNGSQIDQTGWDFIVEFDFPNTKNAKSVHQPGKECKIQI